MESCSTRRMHRCTTLLPEHACTTSVLSSASPAHPCSPTNTLPWNVAGHLLPSAAQCSTPSGATCGPSACTGCGATAAGVAGWVGFYSGRLGSVGLPGRAWHTAATVPAAPRIHTTSMLLLAYGNGMLLRRLHCCLHRTPAHCWASTASLGRGCPSATTLGRVNWGSGMA